MKLGLKESEQLILVVSVLRNNLDKINMFFNDLNQQIIANLKPPTHISFLVIQGPNPGLKERSLDPQVVPTITHLLHVPTENDPRTQADLLGQLPQLLIVDNPTQNPSQESLSLARITLRQIRRHTQAQNPIPQELQLLIVILPKRQTVSRSFGQNGDLIGGGGGFLPQLRPIHIGLMDTGLGKELKIGEAPLPAIPLKNRDRIRRSELPILWIPRTKGLDDYV
jgi:hypothetical protein